MDACNLGALGTPDNVSLSLSLSLSLTLTLSLPSPLSLGRRSELWSCRGWVVSWSCMVPVVCLPLAHRVRDVCQYQTCRLALSL